VRPALWAAALWLWAGAAAPASANSVPLVSGHVDVAVGLDGGAFRLHFHDDDDNEYDPRPPGDTTPGSAHLVVPSRAWFRYTGNTSLPNLQPAGAQWAFLGAGAGNPVAILPQAFHPEVLFLGFGAEDLPFGDAWFPGGVARPINFTVTNVSRPAGGEFSVWQTDSFGNPVVRVATSDGLTSGDVVTILAGGHEHFNWGFTQPGRYDVTMTVSATDGFGNNFSDTQVLTFLVAPIPEPATWAPAGLALGGGLLLLRRRRPAGA
jgi:surface-anchored protein